MTSSFAAQLKVIAAKSNNELDLKAQKAAHSQSLIFEKKIAGSQDFETIYQLCIEGFEDLCKIDPRFRDYRRNLFSNQSKTQERDQMTADQNKTLDTVLEAFLGLLGSRLLLSPAVKVAEWLVRRFRVHEYNTSVLLLTFLPYHATPIFRNLLSILPSQLIPQFKFLGPYITTLTNPPRHAIAYGLTNNDALFAAFNVYTLQVCHAGSQHQTQLAFWASITGEAITGRLDMARSGRKEIERQRQEDVLLKVLPLLKDGLSMEHSLDMALACFTFIVILASKSQLTDKLLDGLMEAVAGAIQTEIANPGLICLSILTKHKSDQSITKKVVSKLAKVADLEVRLRSLNQSHHMEVFTLAAIQSIVMNIRAKEQHQQHQQHQQVGQQAGQQFGLLERLLLAGIVQPARLVVPIGSLLSQLENIGQKVASISLGDSISDLLRKLGDSDEFSPVMMDAVRASGVDLSVVEGSLQLVIDPPEPGPAGMDKMEIDSEAPDQAQSPLSLALAHIPERTVEEHSFLSHTPSPLFRPLLDAFVLAYRTKEGLQSFQDLPLWRSSADVEQPLFPTFFVRIFCGPHVVQIRHAALKILGLWLSKHADFDSQAILPYILLQLADQTQTIRKTAADVLLAIDRATPAGFMDGKISEGSPLKQLHRSERPDPTQISQTAKDVTRAIHRAVLPVIEECVMDPTQIQRALENALSPRTNNDQVNGRTEALELKKHIKQSLVSFLLRHIISTPIYSVKIGLIRLLANIEKVGATRKQKELMPLLLDWASLTAEAAGRLASAEHIDISHVTSAMCSIVSLIESDAVQILLGLIDASAPKRPDLIAAVSERIRYFWPQLKLERRLTAADSLLDLFSHDQAESLDCLQSAKLVLGSVDLSTDVLIHLLDGVHSLIHTVSEHSPALKRRRNNESQAVMVDKTHSRMVPKLRRVMFVLELVDNSSIESRPHLLTSLFQVFDALHQLKLRHNSDLSYMLLLSLGTLLSIVRDPSSSTSRLDLSTVRLDVVIDCMRTSSNPQVQNTALLLVAAISSIAPELVVDSIMPVFTFIGTDIVGRGDEYSSHVVDQTMEKIIPPLIRSLQGRGKDVIAETSDLITSFAVAYEHILPSRRLGLFKKLVSNLGDETFLWVVISSLTNRYAEQADVMSFVISLINSFEIDIQMKTCTSLIVLVQGAVSTKSDRPTNLQEPKSSDAKTPLQPQFLLSSIDEILTESNMKRRIAKLEASGTLETRGLVALWEDLLGRVIHLVHSPEIEGELLATSKTVLSSLLDLMPIITFFDVAEHFVEAGPELVRRTVLRLLESRLHTQHERSSLAQTKAITLLQSLFGFLSQSEDQISKHAAIACVDRICEIYGRKDIPAVLQAAHIISGDNCLSSPDNKLNTIAVLCLSSITELVKEAIVPVIPNMVPKLFRLLRSSIEGGSDQLELHNACFTLLSALLAHVPFMISEDYLDHILTLCAESRAEFQDSGDTDVIRGQVLQLIAKNIELAIGVGSLQRTWVTTVAYDVPAVQQALSLLSSFVKTAKMSSVIKKADQIFAFLLQTFDLRRIQFTKRTEDSYTDTDVAEIEQTINSVAIEFIYKLNDSTFRPVFLHFIDWAVKCQDVKSSHLSKAHTLRKTTLFHFLARFFNTLGSIVTSYGTHIVEPVIAVLTEISTTALKSSTPSHPSSKSKLKSPRKPLKASSPAAEPAQPATSDPELLPLYLSTLSALHPALHHDHDAHFSNPSLFTPLASTLVARLHLASHPTFGPHISTALIPTIVQLATAVVDTPEHLKQLNSLICALRREEDVAVRRASVELQLALAGAGAEGKDGGVGGGEEDGEGEAGIAEEWCGTVLSIGEGMVYVNELLEDEDEVVERKVRKLVRRVRDVLGEESIFD